MASSEKLGGVQISGGEIGAGQDETELRVEANETANGPIALWMTGQADGDAQPVPVTVPVRVRPLPKMTVQVKGTPPDLRAGDVVKVSLSIARFASGDSPARFAVDVSKVPPGVVVSPRRGPIPADMKDFDFSVSAGTNSPPGKFVLPITVYLDQPELERKVSVELTVVPSK